MPLRIAVASEDGRFIQQHFGRARQFMICEIVGTEATVVEVRENKPACGSAWADDDVGHDDDWMNRSVDLVADCDAVIAARIGPSAVERLERRGVRAFINADTIERALSRVVDSGILKERTRPARTGEVAA